MSDDLQLIQDLYARATKAETQAQELEAALMCMTAMTIACGGKIIVDGTSAAKVREYELLRYRDESLNAFVIQARPAKERNANETELSESHE